MGRLSRSLRTAMTRRKGEITPAHLQRSGSNTTATREPRNYLGASPAALSVADRESALQRVDTL
jgi:hypothetical protein